MGKDTERQPTFSSRGETAGIGAVEDPLDFIADDHMREREVCALIDRLASAAPLQDVDIHQILAFLEVQMPQHLADEEIDLFPMMLERCDPEDEIEKVIDKLLADHGHAFADASDIITIIQSVDGSAPKLPDYDCQKMSAFTHHARRHLILENAIILPIARARLTDDDLAVMKRHMLERRGLQSTSEDGEC